MEARLNRGLDRDRLSVITGALLLALALTRLIDVPAQSLEIMVLGSPLGITLSETTVMFLIIVGLAITGVESLVRSHPLVQQGKIGRTLIFWIVPALLFLALSAWLSRIQDLGLWTLALLGSALLTPLALAAEYAAVAAEQRRDTLLQWSYAVLVHLVALILFAVLYGANLRGLLAGPAAFLATCLLATRLMWTLTNDGWQALLYGAICGLVLGEAIWVLNYWTLSTLQGGLFLLILFYVVGGLLQQWFLGRFNHRIVVEYGTVAALALFSILLFVS